MVVGSRSTLRPGVSECLPTAMYIIESQWSETAILIKTVAMDIDEPQRPECGSLIEPTATDIVEHTLHLAGAAQILDCYRNGYRRASEARFGSAGRYRKRLPWALWNYRHQRVRANKEKK